MATKRSPNVDPLTQPIGADDKPAEGAREGRKHIATYARDKRKGGYLVRVIGPNAEVFTGREVPVTRRDQSETRELLKKLIWTGIDNGTPDNPGTGLPAALYTFEPKPREEEELAF